MWSSNYDPLNDPLRFQWRKRGSYNNIPHEHLLITKVWTYIVHLLSTYVSGTIRWNCGGWMTRPRFTSSSDVRGISCHRNLGLDRHNNSICTDWLYVLNRGERNHVSRLYYIRSWKNTRSNAKCNWLGTLFFNICFMKKSLKITELSEERWK